VVEAVLVEVAEGFDCPSEGTFPDPDDCSRWDRELDWTGFTLNWLSRYFAFN
jgi:hypothetical protein